MKRKWLAVGIILIFVGASMTPSIGGHISENENIVRQINDSNSANDTIYDWIEDVYSVNQTGTTTIVANSTDIEVDNIDILQVTFSKQELQVNLSLQVVGIIEDRGSNGTFFDDDMVVYYFQLITSEQDYMISYCNQTGELQCGNESINLTSSDFSVVDDTLSIWFSLMSQEETFENLYAGSNYVKMNKLHPNPSEIVYLYDLVPNILGKVVCIGLIHNINTTRDYILFNPIFMTTTLFIPFHFYPLSKGPIIVSRNYLGYVGRWFIIGLFDVDLSIFWPAQNPTPLITHQIRNSLYTILHG